MKSTYNPEDNTKIWTIKTAVASQGDRTLTVATAGLGGSFVNSGVTVNFTVAAKPSGAKVLSVATPGTAKVNHCLLYTSQASSYLEALLSNVDIRLTNWRFFSCSKARDRALCSLSARTDFSSLSKERCSWSNCSLASLSDSNCSSRSEPVSYTHLDVYKRQVLNFAVASKKILKPAISLLYYWPPRIRKTIV